MDGTSYQGIVNTTYKKLVKVFGNPTTGGSFDGKVNVEWELENEDGVVFTIYDWKEDKIPKGKHDWHIGGFSDKAVDVVLNAIDEV